MIDDWDDRPLGGTALAPQVVSALSLTWIWLLDWYLDALQRAVVESSFGRLIRGLE